MFSLETIGGRKFIGFVVLLAAGVLIEVYGKQGLTATMAMYLGGLYAAFTTANAVTTSMAAKFSSQQSPEVPTAAATNSEQVSSAEVAAVLSQIATALQSIQQSQGANAQAVNILQQSTEGLQKAIGTLISVDRAR